MPTVLAATPTSVDTLDVIVSTLPLVSLCSFLYMLGKVTRMVVYKVVSML